VKFFHPPKVRCQASFDERIGLVDRHIVQVSVEGWGWIKINQQQTAFKSFFFQGKQWQLLFPGGQETHVTVANIFGRDSQALIIDPLKKSLKSDALLAKLKPTLSSEIDTLSAKSHQKQIKVLLALDKVQSQNVSKLNASVAKFAVPRSKSPRRIKHIPATPTFEIRKPIALSQPLLDKADVEPQLNNSLIDMPSIFKVLHKEIHSERN